MLLRRDLCIAARSSKTSLSSSVFCFVTAQCVNALRKFRSSFCVSLLDLLLHVSEAVNDVAGAPLQLILHFARQVNELARPGVALFQGFEAALERRDGCLLCRPLTLPPLVCQLGEETARVQHFNSSQPPRRTSEPHHPRELDGGFRVAASAGIAVVENERDDQHHDVDEDEQRIDAPERVREKSSDGRSGPGVKGVPPVVLFIGRAKGA